MQIDQLDKFEVTVEKDRPLSHQVICPTPDTIAGVSDLQGQFKCNWRTKTKRDASQGWTGHQGILREGGFIASVQ